MAKQTSSAEKESLPKTLSLLPLRDFVPLPGLMVPVYIRAGVGSEAVDYALSKTEYIILCWQIGENDGPLGPRDLSKVGALARVINCVILPNGDMKVRFHVLSRAKITSVVQFEPFVKVKVTHLPEESVVEVSSETQVLMEIVRGSFGIIAGEEAGSDDLLQAQKEIVDPGHLADFVISSLGVPPEDAQPVLEQFEPIKRLQLVSEMLVRQVTLFETKERILKKANEEFGKAHHEELLREQMRQIQKELGDAADAESEIGVIRDKLKKVKLSPAIREEADRQLRRLSMMHPDSSEAALSRTYLDWIADLPWGKRSKDNLDLNIAARVLDEDHFGLEKPKERILDFLGIRKLKRDVRGPILLLVGPPGVGKTSLGRSIARALGRKFVRMSVGGLRDEAELRGHRRTYVGAMPGRIIQGLKSAGTSNPVFILDEIDKIGSDYRGDPASVLLEILDPEQNAEYDDHYLGVPFNLSQVMFIATANRTDTIPGPLLDRMEVIELAGYTNEEKLEISFRYLIPRAAEENGLKDCAPEIPQKAVKFLISGYTRESGVRDLSRMLQTVMRKAGRLKAEGLDVPEVINEALIEKFIGPIRYPEQEKMEHDEVGVVTGLAWTPVGGETLIVEAEVTPGSGKLNLTGQMGDVMRESAQAALTYVQAHAEQFKIDNEVFAKCNIHIHVPQGAIPKDGPSAGIAMATALVSLLGKRKVHRDVAMTGEITLRGRVIGIGGLKEKALGAMRTGIKTVIYPKANTPDLSEFPQYLLEQINFVAVEHLDEVLAVALCATEG